MVDTIYPIYHRKIVKSSQYKFVYTGKNRISNENFNIFFRFNNQSFSYFGISISKKTGNSPQRHLFKRWILESLKEVGYEFPISYNIVFSIKSDHKIQNFLQVKKELISIAHRIFKKI